MALSFKLLQDYWQIDGKLLIAPHIAGSADPSKPLIHFKEGAPKHPLVLRTKLLYFRGSCLPYKYQHDNQTGIATGKVCQHLTPLRHLALASIWATSSGHNDTTVPLFE